MATLRKVRRFVELNQVALQSWCQEVLRDRFKMAYIAHHRPINTLKPLKITNSPKQRAELTEKFRFDFSAFARLLEVLGFWERTGLRMDSSHLELVTQDKTFPDIVNILNGGSDIDYESLYPEAKGVYQGLKVHRFGQQDPLEHEQPSPLTVPDILLGAILERLNRGLPTKVRARAENLSLLNLDRSVPNVERIKICQELEHIYDVRPVTEDQRVLDNSLERALGKLGLSGYGHTSVSSIRQLKEVWRGVDLVVPVMHYDFGRAGWESRRFLKAFPDAFVCPAGLQMPYYAKGSGEVPTQYTEAEEMIATLLCEEYPDNFRDLPGMEPLPPYPAAQPWDILIPSEESGIDTPGNAKYVAGRLPGLCDTLQHKANVLIVTTIMHSARAWAEFHAELPEDLVLHLGVWEVPSPVMQSIGSFRDVHGILGMLCEYVKRLYMVATS